MGAKVSRSLCFTGDGPARVFEVPVEGAVKIGSDPSCELHLAAPGILKLHCLLRCSRDAVGLIVRDPQAAVTVNGERVERKVLAPGDRIGIGKLTLVFESGVKDELVGATIGGYRLEERLGGGAMGTVYKARQLSLDRTVALKILSAELTRDRDFVAGFLREARAAAKLNHPNVAQIYDAGQDGERFFFSMEFLPGGSLARRLERENQLPLLDALRVARDAAQALAWAEEHGIVHRDIKPDNLLLAADGTVKVADLGIAVEKSPTGDEGRARGGVGSPRYMAPEQASGKAVDHRADVYALGSTLYRMLSGRAPFEGKTAREILQAKATADAPALEGLLPGMPGDVAALVKRMMARSPDGRYPTCAGMLEAIEESLGRLERGEEEAADLEDDRGQPQARRLASRPARARGLSVQVQLALAASVLLILGVIAWAVVRSKNAATSGERVTAAVSGPAGVARAPERPPAGTRGQEAAETGAPESEPERTASRRQAPPPRHAEGVDSEEPDREEPGPDARSAAAGSSRVGDSRGRVAAELDDIVTEWKAGLIDARVAIARLENMKERYPDAKEEADRRLAQLRENLGAANREAINKALKEELAPLVAGARFGEAEQLLAKLLNQYPENAAEVAAERRRLEEVALVVWKKAEAAADEAAAAGNFVAARDRLTSAGETLPETLRAGAAQAVIAMQREESAYRERAQVIDAAESAMRQAAAAGDFTAAGAQTAALPEFNGSSVSERLLTRRRALLVEEAGRLGEAWKRLQGGAARAAADSPEVTFADEPTARFRLKGAEAALVAVQAAGGGRTEKRELLRLATASLLLLWGRGGPEGEAAAEASPAALEGIGLLLLYASGPDRARELLLDPRLGGGKAPAYEARLKNEAASHLARSVQALRARIEALEKEAPAKKGAAARGPEEWESIAAELGRLIASARGSQPYQAVRGELVALFLRAKAEALRAGIPQSLFRGKVKSYDKAKGSIELVYQPTDPECMGDFVATIPKTSRAEIVNKTFKIRGEFRLGRGDPFRGRLGVTGSVPGNGYSGQEPNINVALWTRDGDRITANTLLTIEERVIPPPGAPKTDAPAGDYFAFGIGYRSALINDTVVLGGYNYGYLKVPGLKNVNVPMPANALFVVARGSPIHTTPEDECIWATGVISKIKGPQVFKVLMTSDSLTWLINGRRIPINESTEIERLRQAQGSAGSLTIFTNGAVVSYVSFLVEGDLNPAWVDEELKRQAEAALKKVEPDYPFGAKKKGAEKAAEKAPAAATEEAEWEKMLEKPKPPPVGE